MLGKQSQKLRFVGSNASFSLMLLFTQYKTTGLTIISNHCLAALPAKTSVFSSHMRQNAYYRNLKWTFEDLLPCYCYAIKTKSKTIRLLVWQPAFAWKWADMSELQAHHCMIPEQWTWSVSVILANKLSLH